MKLILCEVHACLRPCRPGVSMSYQSPYILKMCVHQILQVQVCVCHVNVRVSMWCVCVCVCVCLCVWCMCACECVDMDLLPSAMFDHLMKMEEEIQYAFLDVCLHCY
jgi:hypothetical protein